MLCHRGLAIADVNAAQAAVKSAYGFKLFLGPAERLALGSAVRKVAAAGAMRASPAAGEFATAAKVATSELAAALMGCSCAVLDRGGFSGLVTSWQLQTLKGALQLGGEAEQRRLDPPITCSRRSPASLSRRPFLPPGERR